MAASRNMKSRFMYFSAAVCFISIALLDSAFFLIANKLQVDDAKKFLNTALNTAWSQFYDQPRQLNSYFQGSGAQGGLLRAVRGADRAFLRRQLEAWRRAFPAAQFWAVTDAAGHALGDGGDLRDLNQCYPHVVRRLRETRKPIISTELIPASVLEKENPALAAKARIIYRAPTEPKTSFNDALVNVAFFPLLDERRALVGILSGGFLLNNDSDIAREYTRKIPNTYLSIAVGGVRVVSNIDVRIDSGLFSHPTGTRQMEQMVEHIGKGVPFRGLETVDAKSYGLVAADPVKNSADQVVAGLAVGAPINMLNPFKRQGLYLLFLIGFVDLGLAMLLSQRLSEGILAPLYRLKQLASGITNQTVDPKHLVWSERAEPKEISELASTIVFMAKDLKEKESEIKVYAQDLAEEKATLEARVADRTSELARAIHELKHTNQYKSQFLANMSHELRTPLTSIIGFGKLLEEQTAGELNARQKKYSHIIVTSANQLLELINEILNLVKMEQYRDQPSPSSISLPEAVNYVATLFEDAINKGRLTLVTRVPAELPRPFWDFRKIIQLVSNLMANAVKFTRENGLIEIQAAQENDSILMVVRDNGIGIKPEHQERVFLAFEQAESSYTRQYQGTGLGLSICKKIVEMHQGRIWLESEFGVGTSIFVLLPIVPAFQSVEGDEPHDVLQSAGR
jgi:signal transduction histidine kinase